MSYFSDSSSTYSAPPVTPSHYQHSIPSLPSTQSYSSPYDNDHLVSPPDSIRLYSSALKARMAAGLTAAMQDLKDDRGGPERKFDVEYGYDEDPIERHVKLHLTPRKLPERSKALPELGLGMRPTSAPPPPKVTATDARAVKAKTQFEVRPIDDEDSEMLAPAPQPQGDAYLLNSDDDPDLLPTRFRPGLIHFHRSNSSSNTRPTFARMDSTVSEASTVSMLSEASFEAVKADDIISMYGGGAYGVKRADGPFVDDDEEDRRISMASMDSTDTRETFRPTKTLRITPQPSAGPSYQPSQTQAPFPAQILPQGHPASQSASTSATAPAPALITRPSLLRPRPRAHPYEQPAETDQAEPDWLAGRTLSERMVAQAGLRCQRQRVGALRAGR